MGSAEVPRPVFFLHQLSSARLDRLRTTRTARGLEAEHPVDAEQDSLGPHTELSSLAEFGMAGVGGAHGSGVRWSASVSSTATGFGIGGRICIRSVWRCFHRASADSPIPCLETSSRAMAVSTSLSSSNNCNPPSENLPSMASETSIFFAISLRQLDCIVSA